MTSKKTISTESTSSITSSKEESFENSLSTNSGSLETTDKQKAQVSTKIVESHEVEEQEIKHEEISENNKEMDALNDDQDRERATSDKKLTKDGSQKKKKKAKKSDSEKENISVVSAKTFYQLTINNDNFFLNIFEFLCSIFCLWLVRNACTHFYHCLMFYVKLNGIKIFNQLTILAQMSQSTLAAKALTGCDQLKSASATNLNARRKSEEFNEFPNNNDCEKINNSKNRKFIISSNMQLHDDDLSRVNVRQLVRTYPTNSASVDVFCPPLSVKILPLLYLYWKPF